MNSVVKEGDLYKVINLFGKAFEIRYGYYSEAERLSEFSEAIPIYPDFVNCPQYTSEGCPFVTQMQDVCEHYEGKETGDDCFSCKYYCHGEDLLGICVCDSNKPQGGNKK